MALTDKQLLAAFTINESLSDSNGRRCGRRKSENGVLGTEYTCEGRTTIEGGKVIIQESCGEPCDFVCTNAHAFSQDVERLKAYDRIIERVKA